MMNTSVQNPVQNPMQCVMTSGPLDIAAFERKRAKAKAEADAEDAEDAECYRSLLSCWCLCYLLETTIN